MWDTLERIHKDSRNAWLGSDESSAGSSFADSKMDVCLMAREESASNNVSTSSSTKCDSYYQLLDAFKETREEANRLTLSKIGWKVKTTGWKKESKFWKKIWIIQNLILKT